MLIIIQDGNSVTLMTINYSIFPVDINHCHPSLHMESVFEVGMEIPENHSSFKMSQAIKQGSSISWIKCQKLYHSHQEMFL